MKVALVHDWLTGYRGGERVLKILCEMYPDAPIYTLVHVPGSVPKAIESHKIHTSFIQHLPRSAEKYRHYLPFFPAAAESLGVRGYDLIISTSHAVAKSIPTYGAKHWCYIHTPMRYVWDRFDDYFGEELVGTAASKYFFGPIAAGLRKYDKATADRVGHYVANSRFVADRVQRFYERGAEVICPPVEDKYRTIVRKPEDFYLFFSALVPYKKADHAIAACQSLGRRLIIIGHGPELPKLRSIANPELVTFIENPTDEVVADHYTRAKALIFPAIEDFGIVPVEALSAGLPVIGPRMGGLLDSQTDETCLFYENQTVIDLIDAIKKFENESSRFDPRILRARSELFSEERFRSAVQNSIQRFLTTN